MQDIKQTETTLKALANGRRLSIIKYLKHVHKASVGDIAAKIRLSFKSTSHHLLILLSVGILEREQVGLTMLYSISKDQKLGAKEVIWCL